MKQCLECQILVTESHAECPGCGASVGPAGEACDHCGELLAAGAKACPECGHLVVSTQCERHADRGAVGRCVLCGRALCEECDTRGRARHVCATHADVPVIEGWAEVLSIPDEFEAKLIEGNLRAEGVEARILSQKDHFAIPVEFGDLARVRVLVPLYAFGEAERILAAHSDERGEVSFGCPNCGEPYEEGETACAACGEALV